MKIVHTYKYKNCVIKKHVKLCSTMSYYDGLKYYHEVEDLHILLW